MCIEIFNLTVRNQVNKETNNSDKENIAFERDKTALPLRRRAEFIGGQICWLMSMENSISIMLKTIILSNFAIFNAMLSNSTEFSNLTRWITCKSMQSIITEE